MDTRRECRNSVLFPGPKLMVSQISELRAKLEESETALAEAKATIGALIWTAYCKSESESESESETESESESAGRVRVPRKRRALCAAGRFLKAVLPPGVAKVVAAHGVHMDVEKWHRTTRQKMRWNTRATGMVRGILVEYLYNNSYG